MNWNSIVRTVTAFAVYLALVSAYFAGLSPLGFALFTALVLSVGLWIHSVDLTASVTSSARGLGVGNTSTNSAANVLVPSLTESMTQLHTLQTEINELQAQFSIDTESRSGKDGRDGSNELY